MNPVNSRSLSRRVQRAWAVMCRDRQTRRGAAAFVATAVVLAGVVVWRLAMASTVNVTTTADTVDGVTTSIANLQANRGSDGLISLREAVLAVINDSATGPHTVVLPAGTYNLSSGELSISANVNIQGADAATTIISGQNASRVFNVSSGLTVSGLAVRNGSVNGNGGCVLASGGSFTATNVTLSNCAASNAQGGVMYATGTSISLTSVVVQNGSANSGHGGGLFVQDGSLNVASSTFSGNNASNGGGGAVWLAGTSNTNITDTTFSANNSGSTGGAGVGMSSSGSLAITGATFSANTGNNGAGGGLYVGSGTATVTNATFNGNSTNNGGGAIATAGGTLSVVNVTVAGNSVMNGASGLSRSGGTLTLRNTIISANSGGTGNCAGTITNAANNLDSGTTCGFGTANGSLSSTDPLLSALASNGGSTQTMALGAGSPAINSGTSTGAPATDQRGYNRSGATDIGAYEFGGSGAATYAVTGTVFEDVNYGGGAGRSLAASAGVPRPGATVELYTVSGSTATFSASTTTNGSGVYTFSSLAPGSYAVRVVDASVASTRTGYIAGLIPVQTARHDWTSIAAVLVTNQVGGINPAATAAGAATTGAVFNTSTGAFSAGASGTAQSFTLVTLGSVNATGLDFGFNYSTIVNTADSGQGSLRQFISNANALGGEASLAQAGRTAGVESSIFMLPTTAAGYQAGTQHWRITPLTQLVLSSPLTVIDGLSQAGAAAGNLWAGTPHTLKVELFGNGQSFTALTVSGTGSGVRGLVVGGFSSDGVVLTGSNNFVRTSYVGLDVTGTVASSVSQSAVRVSATDPEVGGLGSGDGNVIAGNGSLAVASNGGTTGLAIRGNFIGSNATGTALAGARIWGYGNTSGTTTLREIRRNLFVGNSRGGFVLENDDTLAPRTGQTTWAFAGNHVGVGRDGSTTLANTVGVGAWSTSASFNVTGLVIGGTTATDRNVIAGNTSSGLLIRNSGTGLVIQGNHLGVAADGTTPRANGGDGVYVETSNAVTIGGTAAGAGNVIAHNSGRGVNVASGTGAITIRGNSIHSNGNIGIDLGNDGVTANDGAKTTGRPNQLMDHPVFTSVALSGTTLTLSGHVGSAAGQATFANAQVEVMTADTAAAGNGEGRTYLGTLTANASGDINGSLTVAGLVGGERITGTATDASGNTSEFGANAVVGVSIAGTVFEDVNYGGGAGRNKATALAAGGVGVSGATVDLYTAAGTWVRSSTTAPDGSYSFDGLPSSHYLVRVVQSTVRSSRTGWVAGLWPVQTYRYEASWLGANAVTGEVGGPRPEVADSAAAAALSWVTCATESGGSSNPCNFTGTRVVRFGVGSNWTTRIPTDGVACSTAVFGDPSVGVAKSCQILQPHFHSVSSAAAQSVGVGGLDFGFNFSTVTHTSDSGQGSLRQAITNANALGDDNTLAVAGRTAGIEHVIFTVRPSTPGFTGTVGTDGRAVIQVSSNLPPITASLVIDGTTQTSGIGNTNPGNLGTGGTVGVDALALSTVARPEVELTATSAPSTGFIVSASDVTVRGMAIHGFRGAVPGLSTAAVAVNAGADRVLIEGNVIGATAAAADPGTGLRNTAAVIARGGHSGTLRNNLIAYTEQSGFAVGAGSANAWLIENNEVRETGLNFDNGDGIALGGVTNSTVRGNRVVNTSTQGIFLGNNTSTGLTVINNTVTGSGIGRTAAAPIQTDALAVRSGATAIRVEANIVTANYGAGVAVNSGAAGITLSRNAIYGNGIITSRNGAAATGQVDIDLNAATDNTNFGTAPFFTANDSGDADAGGNNLQNHPTLVATSPQAGQLRVQGTLDSQANGFYRLEFFGVGTAHASGRGGGQTWLGTANVATNASGAATFDVLLPVLPAQGTQVTATATKSVADYSSFSDTSEYSPNVTVGVGLSGTVFEDVNYGGGAGRSQAASGGVGRPGAIVELYDANGAFMRSTTTDAAGGYSFTGVVSGAYTVRVVNGSVVSSRGGVPAGLVAVQTYRTEAGTGTATAVVDHVGGLDPASADAVAGAAGTSLWTLCSPEYTTCSFTGTRIVRYGIDSGGVSGWATRVLTGGTECGNAVFGDPYVGLVKNCYVLNAAYQSVTSVAAGSTAVTGLDFGFNFDTVVNTRDSGQGSLRQVMTNAEALTDDAALAVAGRTAAAEHVIFMLSNGTAAAGLRSSNNSFSAGVATISPASALPPLAARLVIDAQTQPGWLLAPIVELNGSGAGVANGLTINGAGSVVRGLVINRFSEEGIYSASGAGHVIQGNYIGTNAAGTVAAGNAKSGIWFDNAAGGHLIGGTTEAQRNVLSGNTRFDGVAVLGGSGTLVQGNHIGVNAAGTALIPNGRWGVVFYGGVRNSMVGGTAVGNGNVIAGNVRSGVVLANSNTGNAVLGNSIHGNGGLGIDLGNDGLTVNDGAKPAGRSNLEMDSPVFTSARARGPQLTVAGHVGTAAGQALFGGSRVEVFVSDADGSGHGEGRTYLGALTADAAGNFRGTITMPISAVRAGSLLTGTATDTGNNTSEFGANFSGLIVDWLINHNGDGVDASPGDGLCETSTPGQCTLRAAIVETNTWPGADQAFFDLPSCPGAGCIITPASALPAITGQLTLDGQSQPGWSLAPLVDLRGEGAGAASDGLTVNAAGSIVRGLAVGGFLQSGIRINANNVMVEGVYAGVQPDGSTARANGAYNSMTGGIYVAGGAGIVIGGTAAAQRNVLSGNGGAGAWINAGSVTLLGNLIGTNADGTAAVGNGRWGVQVESGSGHRIGGPAAGEGNVVSGNVGNSKGGIVLVSPTGSTIQGNTIGLNATRSAAIPNGDGTTTLAAGIDLRSTASGNLIGGTGVGEGNVIAGNVGHGVRVSSQTTRILGNAIYGNQWLGIDLGGNGVTANNGTQSTSLPNNDMDHPVITSAGYEPLTRALTLTGYVGTGTGQALFAGARIELFTSDGDITGYGEGSAFVGTLTADANGRFNGTVTVPVSVTFAVGTALTGTATNMANNTSEFGPNYVTTTMAALAPSRFNAFETSTLAGALTGALQTRVAGVAGSVAVIAIDNTGTALQTSFAGTATLEWMNASDNSGALDAGNCRSSWVAAGSAGSVGFVAGDLGRRNVTITPAAVGRVWHLRISYAGPGGTVSSCSTDAFAVRPDTLAITGVSDATDSTAGTARLLDNLNASGGRVHRAGRPFSLRAAARDAASALATGYDGVPTIAITGCVLPTSGCAAGSLQAPALVASGGLIAADTLTYLEVGAINLQLTDDSFADIDGADTPLAQRRIQSAAVGVGRFVPDRYLLAAANAPQFATQQGSCAAAGQGFTFVGQNFGWATAPGFTITAQNAVGGTTALWSGALQKINPAAHVARSLAAANAQGLTPAVSWGTMALTDAGGGVANVVMAGDQFLFTRSAGAPVASFNPLITLGLAVSDVSELAVSGNSAITSTTALVIGSGAGINFNEGSSFHYSRLKLQNAFGDVRRGVRANVELQKFTDRGWLRLSEDNNCVTVPLASIAFGTGSGAFATDACTAPASSGVALRQGRGTLVLPKTAGNIQGAAVVTLNIGTTLEGSACAAGVPVAPTSAALPHLLSARGTGTAQDQNPAARLVWGRQHRDYMVQRELF